MTSLDTSIAAIAPGAVSNIQTNLTTPIIRAFDDATAAVERLIDAIKRLAAMNAAAAQRWRWRWWWWRRRNGRRCWRR